MNTPIQENRLLYRCLAEQKSDVKEALRDKCFVINNVQYEMSELKKHIHLLLGVLAEEQQPRAQPQSQLVQTSANNTHTGLSSLENHHHQQLIWSQLPSTSSSSISPSSSDQSIWMSRNKTLEENFKKELKKVKELERQIGQLSDTLQEVGRDREDLHEKNAFIEEENNIQREQIALLEDTVRDLEEVAVRTGVEVEHAATQTVVSGQELMAILNENVEEIVCLVSKLAELQQENAVLESRYGDSRRALTALHHDFHERGKLMSALENELNGLKLQDRRGRLRSVGSVWDEGEQRLSDVVLNLDASVFLSPNSSRSCSSNSSAEFEEEEHGMALMEEQEESKKVR